MRWIERFEALPESKQRLVLILTGLALLFLATPFNLVSGYLFCEEGSTYLRYARVAGGLRALTAPHQGYYSLLPNVVLSLPARWLPLSSAPWIAAWAALLIRLSTVYFIATCEALERGRVRLYATILLMVLPSAAFGLGTIHAQFYLGTTAALIVLSDPARHRVSRFLALFLGGLDGVLTCIFLPLFLFRAWKTRSVAAVMQAALVALCTAIQMIVVRRGLAYTDRTGFDLASPWIYADSLITHLLLLPFFTRGIYHPVTVLLQTHGVAVWIAVAALGTGLLAVPYFLLWGATKASRLCLVAGLLSAFCTVLSMRGGITIVGGGERYFIVANSCIVFGLVLALEHFRQTAQRVRYRMVSVLLVLIGISGVLDIGRYWHMSQSPLQWGRQLAAWREDPTLRLHNGPEFWIPNSYYLPTTPLSLDPPYFVYDSTVPMAVTQALPQAWFGVLPSEGSPRAGNGR